MSKLVTAAKLCDECFLILWLLLSGVLDAMETSNCRVSFCCAAGDSWIHVWKDFDVVSKKDER